MYKPRQKKNVFIAKKGKVNVNWKNGKTKKKHTHIHNVNVGSF